jgi:hydrogenase maturation protein HypF
MGEDTTRQRVGRRFDVAGTVQGVGFRPFVWRLANELGVDGSVRNTGGHVVVEAAAGEETLAELGRRLTDDAPPLARVSGVSHAALPTPPPAGSGFRIEPSRRSAHAEPEVPPDVATCDDCLAELLDPTDRRYRYPFVNCTNCGPRATIIDGLPYDRARTSMTRFVMCPQCEREYGDPNDRRFHAQPNACPACGPTLRWVAGGHGLPTLGHSALLAAELAIEAGQIVAMKGLGGFQLVCDARRADTVRALRARKSRPAKPFAVMVPGLAWAERIASLTDAERRLLVSRERPIVLLRKRPCDDIAPDVGPGSETIGVFLPYSPLHHLLLGDIGRPLVVTSGNRGDEPMAVDDATAFDALHDIADGFLTHDRPILARYDDSVAQVAGGRSHIIRRARGYAPRPRPLAIAAAAPILAVGAELKHTFTLADHDQAVISSHIGDLECAPAFDSFAESARQLGDVLGISPEIVAHDLHPGYLSTQYAKNWTSRRRMPVQHHHAHVAACAAEFGLTDPFIGVAYDGLGMGDDGTMWGGEILVADLERYRRAARFSYAPMPGGAAAVRRPVRMALGYLFGAETFGEPWPGSAWTTLGGREAVGEVFGRIDHREVEVVAQLVASGLNCPTASSAGRLFDAMAALLGVRDNATYEGEAAIALESVAGSVSTRELPWALRRVAGTLVYDVRPTLQAAVESVRRGIPTYVTAAAFHRTIVNVTAALCDEIRHDTGLDTVCLAGGVFQNRLLAVAVADMLRQNGFAVHLGEQVPCNDGGISFGQAAIAAARSRRD